VTQRERIVAACQATGKPLVLHPWLSRRFALRIGVVLQAACRLPDSFTGAAHLKFIHGNALHAARAGVDTPKTRQPSPSFKEKHMNWDRIKGNWKQAKGKVIEQWGKLTDDDFDVVAGRREQLAGKIQERYGCAKDEAERQLTEWERKLGDDWLDKPATERPTDKV